MSSSNDWHQNGPCSCDSHDTVNHVFAFLVVDTDGTEGIPAFQGPQGPMPMIGADPERMKSIEPIAQAMATGIDKKVELVKFSTREHITWLEP